MGKLSSAIVQRKLATLRDVEEALARQVLYGGDLATNLLEQSPSLDEHALAGLLAEVNGLVAAPAGELPPSESDARLLVPGDVALRHGIYPLAHAGGMLIVAVSEPLKPDVEQDLAFGLGVALTQRVAPLVRIRQAISREYGMPLDRRSQRVVAKLEGRIDPSPSMTPAPLTTAPDISALPRPPTMPPLGLPAPMDMTPLYARLSSPSVTVAPSTRPLPDQRAEPAITKLLSVPIGAPKPVPVPEDDLPIPPDSIHERLTSPAPPVEPIPEEQPTAPWPAGSTALIGPGADRPSEPPPSRNRLSSIPPERGSVPPPSRRPGSGQYAMPEGLAAWTAESKQAERRRKSRHRGPYTTAQAEQDLLAADGRDDVLTAFFGFACQYFEYSVLFAVQGDLAEGKASSGPGADRSVVTGIGVPLDLPSSLATVRNEGRFSVAPLTKDGLDGRLAGDLSRKPGKKVLLLPVLVRGRCVLVLYGDDGTDDVELSEIGDVIAFAPLVANALEAMILRKKAAVRSALGEGPASLRPMSRRAPLASRESRVEALSDALHTTVRFESNEGESITRVSGNAIETPIPTFNPTSAAQRALTPALGTQRQGSSRDEPSLEFEEEESTDETAEGDELPLPPPEDEITHPPKRIVRREEMAGGLESIPPEPNPASAAIAVAPQLPVRRHQSEELRLPSVILNIESDIELLVQRLIDGDETAISRLAGLGAAAASVLVSKFPGPTKPPTERGGVLDVASQRGPILKALVRIGQTSVPFLAVRGADPEPKVREWATLLLGELPGADSAHAVARRVSDSNPAVRRAALEAGRLLQSDDDSRSALRERVLLLAEDNAAPVDARVAALEALAHFRDTRAVPRIVKLVDKTDEASQSAQWALSIITRQAFGRDVEAWNTWWKENGPRHRIEWLIDALMHDDAEIRRAAGEELKALTKEYFGYYDDLSKNERSKAAKRYREWWEAAGKARFLR